MWLLIAVLIIVVLVLVIYSILQIQDLKHICGRINYKLTKLDGKLDTNKLVLETQNKKMLELINKIKKIVFSNEDSLVKVSKIIELLRKYNNSQISKST